jgi:hypothetical protein
MHDVCSHEARILSGTWLLTLKGKLFNKATIQRAPVLGRVVREDETKEANLFFWNNNKYTLIT